MRLKYFLPDWEDRLDPNFDFVRDKYSKKHKQNPYQNDLYAHNLFDIPPYDGILFSLSVFQSKIKLEENGDGHQIRGKINIKDYLKLPRDSTLEIMGDCGAFGYVKEDNPPQPYYSVENVSRLYENLGFDYGVSVDHLAVDYFFVKDKDGKRKKKPLSDNEKRRRIKITLNNAKKFFELHQEAGYSFEPVGVAQGYDISSYKKSVKKLVDMGYDYVALGALVQYKTKFILKILEEINPIVKKEDIKMHLFGVCRMEYLDKFEMLDVHSFDSASYFRKAWLRSRRNYLASGGEWYAAIRVPQANNPRILKNADLNGFDKDDLERMEKEALQALVEYDNNGRDLEDVLDKIIKYDSLLLRNTDDGDNLREKYERTLKDKPWKKCDCHMCKNHGIHVLIFRGCNRNKRRGFHNIWVLNHLYP